MPLTIKYFASLREYIGRDDEVVDIPANVATAADLRNWLCARGEPYASALAAGKSVRVAINCDMADPQTPLPGSGEVAFFPPVTGG